MFVLVAALISLSPLAYNVVSLLAPDIVDAPAYSSLEARKFAEFPQLSIASVAEGGYQKALEAFLSDHVPGRDQAALVNASLQRLGIASSAAVFGYGVYPTFFDSHYYVVPRDGIIVDRAEAAPADGGGQNLDAWISVLNETARKHPDVNFVYDCVARHDQVEANPTYGYYHDRLNPAWAQENIIDRLDPRIAAFVDAVESYDEIASEWIATEEHWTLQRALKSYNLIADRLSLEKYEYENPVEVVDSWYGDYARNGLDMDIATNLEDLPVDFSSLTFYELGDAGGSEKQMGSRERVLAGEESIESGGVSRYYDYFGGGNAEVLNSARDDGKTLLFIGDSLSYCLTRYFASNYRHSVIVLPGNSRLDDTIESYLAKYDPDDVIVMMHVTKYESIAEYSPKFIATAE